MHWEIRVGDLLDVPADVLVAPANVWWNLSGGVGGAPALRYGPTMQEELHRRLRDRGLRHVPRGEVVAVGPCGTLYRAVLHAVAIDGACETTPGVVSAVVADSLRLASGLGAESVALAALGTGYGRLPIAGFAEAVRPLLECDFPPIGLVTIGLRSRHDAEELAVLLPRLRPGRSVSEPPGDPG